MTTGEKIRAARQRANLTQKQLGELCGIAEPTIRRYETGKLNPKAETIMKIASHLNTDWLWLYLDDETYREIYQKVSAIENAIKNITIEKPYNTEFADMDTDTMIDAIIGVTQEEKDLFKPILNTFFMKLNSDGQQKAYEYIQDLAGNEKYRKLAEDTPITTSGDDEKPEEE